MRPRRSSCRPASRSRTSRRRRSPSTRPARSSPRSDAASPAIVGPKKEDICYATSNRQWAVKDMLAEIDLLLVIGSRNSSNSNRLVDVARAASVPAYLIDDESEIDERGSRASRPSGSRPARPPPSGSSTRVCDWFRARGVERIEPYRMVDEDVTFRLPVELRRELALADARTE